mgnify:CR=1 FL=1
MTKTTYAATAPDGSQHTRTSHRSYTHAVLLEDNGPEGPVWTAVGFCGRADLARKKQGEHPGSIVVECDVLGAEPTDDAAPEAAEEETATDERTWTSAADGTPGPEAEQPVEPKPTISALVKRLLMDETLDYASIVEQVVAEFPDARTTARSVASVAAVMRKKGVDVPLRKGSKG